MIKIQTVSQQKEFAQFLQLNRSEIHLDVKFVNSEDFKLFQEYQMYISKFKSMFGDISLSRSTNEDLTQSQSPSRHELQQSTMSNNTYLKNSDQQQKPKAEQNLEMKQEFLSQSENTYNNQDSSSIANESQLKSQYKEGDSLKDENSILDSEECYNQSRKQQEEKLINRQIGQQNTNVQEGFTTPQEFKKFQYEEYYKFDSEIKEKAVFKFYSTELDDLLINENIKFVKKDRKYVLSYNSSQLKKELMDFFASIQIDSVFIDEISIKAHELSPKYQKSLNQKRVYTLSVNDQLFFISTDKNRDLKELIKRYKKYRGIIIYFNTLSPIGDAVDFIGNELMIDRQKYFESQRQKFNFNFIDDIEYVITDASHAVIIHMIFVQSESLQNRDFENAQQYMMELIQTNLRNLFYCQFVLQSEGNYVNQFQKFGQLIMQRQEKQQISIRCENRVVSLLGEKGDIIELFQKMKMESFRSDLFEQVIVNVKIQHNSLQDVVNALLRMKCDIANFGNDFLRIQPSSDIFVYLKDLAQKHMSEEEYIIKLINKLNKYNLNEKGEPVGSFFTSSINLSNTNESSLTLYSELKKGMEIQNIFQQQFDQNAESSLLSSQSKLQDKTVEIQSEGIQDERTNFSYENPRNEIVFDLENYQQTQNIESNQLIQIMRQFTTNQLFLRVPYVSQQYRNYFHSLGIHKPIKIFFVTRNNRKYTSFPPNMVFYKNEVAAKNKFLSEKYYVLVEMLVYPKAKYRELKENPNQMCFKEANQVCPNIALYQI